MYKRILVALDRSKFSQVVFERALELARDYRASLLLFHALSSEEWDELKPPNFYVLEYPLAWADDRSRDERLERWREYEKRGLERSRHLVERAKAVGVDAEFTQIPGNPGRGICRLAENWKADLVVMGRRGRSGLNELVLGSESNHVLHHAPCSVLIVQAGNHVSEEKAAEKQLVNS